MSYLRDRYNEYKQRQLKRKLLKDGVIENRKELLWEYNVNGDTGQVRAFNRSEAKARVKDLLSIKGRFPILGIIKLVERIYYE